MRISNFSFLIYSKYSSELWITLTARNPTSVQNFLKSGWIKHSGIIFEAELAFSLPTNLVPNKMKEKRFVAEIYATTVDENKTGGGNFPSKHNRTQGRNQGRNLK